MKILVVIIHGIGMQDKAYADSFIKKIEQKYGKGNLIFEPICWQEDIQLLEDALYKKEEKLGWRKLRKFLIGYAGDAICYQQSIKERTFYNIIHDKLDRAISRIHNLEGKIPLVIISHSLGTIVASDFVWDCQHRINGVSKESIDMVDGLELFYTMGSPLAKWSLMFEDGGMPISISSAGKWYNLYSRSDIISSGVKIINNRYNLLFNLHDVEVSVGGLFRWSVLSHIGYWDSDRVVSHIVNNLVRVDRFWNDQIG